MAARPKARVLKLVSGGQPRSRRCLRCLSREQTVEALVQEIEKRLMPRVWPRVLARFVRLGGTDAELAWRVADNEGLRAQVERELGGRG